MFVWLLPTGAAAAPETAAAGSTVHAQGRDAADLVALAAELASAEAGRRDAAAKALRTLQPESLPGLSARLDALLTPAADAEPRREAFQALRHAAGSRRADDDVDLVPGVSALLATRRDAEALRAAELLLLLRALERIATRQAGQQIARYAGADAGLWRNELRLLRGRAGLHLLPALIELRSHPNGEVKRWAQHGVRALGMTDPSVVAELPDPLLLSEVARAYAEPLDFPAMPTLVRLVDHDSAQVRSAARWAVSRFGKNAIWQLRELYEELAGKRAERSWDHERTAQALYAIIDRERSDELQRLLDRGTAAFVDGRLDDMERDFDMLLARAPEYEARDRLAPGYAALGARRLEQDALSSARAAYRRALRLAPDATQAPKWRAALEFAHAEQRLSRGLLDLDGYARAQALDPEHAPAAQAIDVLSGAKAERERRNKRLAAALAAVLLLGIAWLAWRGERSDGARDEREPSEPGLQGS